MSDQISLYLFYRCVLQVISLFSFVWFLVSNIFLCLLPCFVSFVCVSLLLLIVHVNSSCVLEKKVWSANNYTKGITTNKQRQYKSYQLFPAHLLMNCFSCICAATKKQGRLWNMRDSLPWTSYLDGLPHQPFVAALIRSTWQHHRFTFLLCAPERESNLHLWQCRSDSEPQ